MEISELGFQSQSILRAIMNDCSQKFKIAKTQQQAKYFSVEIKSGVIVPHRKLELVI